MKKSVKHLCSSVARIRTLGLLLNFGSKLVQVKRFARTR